MSGAEDDPGPVDEFDQIARLFRPLTDGAPEALSLLDDAAVLSPPPDTDLVLTKDAMVAGVHFLPDDPLDLVARKLLRVNLSDLAAMGADPWGYLLAVAWPPGTGWGRRKLFAEGLRQDQAAFGLRLLGGDTVATPGPMTVSATLIGRVPRGQAVTRAGAKAGDLLLVSGTIGDAHLGLRAAQGALPHLSREGRSSVEARYRLPVPRLTLIEALRRHASAAADVSDGLVADAGRIGLASGVGLILDLDRMPVSASAALWLAGQAEDARVALATGGDDYEIVCTAAPENVEALRMQAEAAGCPLTVVGRVVEGEGVSTSLGGRPIPIDRAGWRHG
jgi:thiamine-monophosphate kinase